jgi:hypothetical protein
MGGTTDWAVDLAKFMEPPNYRIGSVDLDLSWELVKSNIAAGNPPTCDRLSRTGEWTNMQCNMREAVLESDCTPKQRWDVMDCASALEDAIRYYVGCERPKPGNTYDFAEAIALFLRMTSGSVRIPNSISTRNLELTV